MDAVLISKDPELSVLCARIIAEITRDRSWSFSSQPIDAATRHSADLYILDFDPSVSVPEDIPWHALNLVAIAHRRDVAQLKKVLGFDANVILKPPTRSTLSALLGFAISNCMANRLREDRDHIFQCLLEANLKLQEFDQNRTEFVTRLVHDFRAPLTALSGYCGLLLAERLGALSDSQKDVLRRMEYSAKRLTRMASSFLQLSMYRRTKRHPDLQKGDLRARLDQALYEIGPFAHDKRIEIKSVLAPGEEGLYFESTQIDQVLVNLLDNACKFTPRNGTIEIRGYPFFWERRNLAMAAAQLPRERRVSDRTEPNSYRLDVLNSGSPLPKGQLESIFEERTSYTKEGSTSGGGLGLAICRMIIDDHGGRMWAENAVSGPVLSFVLPMYRSGSAGNSVSAA